MNHADSDPEGVVNEFLRRFIADRQAGSTRSLAEYQALWPGHEELVAAEHAGLVGTPESGPAGTAIAPPGYELLEIRGSGRLARAWSVRAPSGEERLLKRIEYFPFRPGRGFGKRLAAMPARVPRGVPGLAALHDAGFGGGVAFTVGDLLSSDSLEDRLRGGAVDRHALLAGLVRVARALHALHGAGLVHGDVRPGNLRFDAAGELTLTDAGWAAALEADWAGMVRQEAMGDLAYRAPEELLVNQSGPEPGADQHALAATAYRALTGVKPFPAAERAALGQAILTMPPRPPRQIDPSLTRDLERVLLRALTKDPAGRHPDLAAFADALEAAGGRRSSRIGRFLGRG